MLFTFVRKDLGNYLRDPTRKETQRIPCLSQQRKSRRTDFTELRAYIKIYTSAASSAICCFSFEFAFIRLR